jgi:hypothetical protein
MNPRFLPWWLIGAEMSSAQQRHPAYVSGRMGAAAGTRIVQARIRRLHDAPGQTAHYA